MSISKLAFHWIHPDVPVARLWSGPLGPDGVQAKVLTGRRVCWSSNWMGRSSPRWQCSSPRWQCRRLPLSLSSMKHGGITKHTCAVRTSPVAASITSTVPIHSHAVDQLALANRPQIFRPKTSCSIPRSGVRSATIFFSTNVFCASVNLDAFNVLCSSHLRKSSQKTPTKSDPVPGHGSVPERSEQGSRALHHARRPDGEPQRSDGRRRRDPCVERCRAGLLQVRNVRPQGRRSTTVEKRGSTLAEGPPAVPGSHPSSSIRAAKSRSPDRMSPAIRKTVVQRSSVPAT